VELVDGEEVPDPVAQLLGDVAGVVGEPQRDFARLPPPLVLEHLRQVPVIERGERLDARRQKLVDQTVVEVDALRVGLARALREDAWPGEKR
jgi:hypothetical protein